MMGLIGLTLMPNVSLAEEEQQAKASYSVNPIFSEHQKGTISSFFDIRWTPGTTEKIGLRITNTANQERTYTISVNKARTNINGVIDYSDSTSENLKGETPKITRLVVFPETVTVEAHSTKEVYTDIQIPSNDFNGIMMAGLHISESTDDASKAGVTNTVAYSIPLVIRGNIDQRPEPILSFGKVQFVKKGVDSYLLTMLVNNEGVNLLKDVTTSIIVKNSSDKILDKIETKLDITPETEFEYPVRLTEQYKPGTYTATITLTHNERTWEQEESFTITSEQAFEINKINSSSKWYQSSWIYVVLLGVLGLVLFLIWLVIVKRKK